MTDFAVLNKKGVAWIAQAARMLGTTSDDLKNQVNPVAPPVDTTKTPGALAPWAPNTAYVANAQVTSSGYIYTAAVGGTSATIPPSAFGTVKDGTVTWTFQGADPAAQQTTPPYDGSGGSGGSGGGGDGSGGAGGGEEGGGEPGQEQDPFADDQGEAPGGAPSDPFADEGGGGEGGDPFADEGGGGYEESSEDPFADEGGSGIDEGLAAPSDSSEDPFAEEGEDTGTITEEEAIDLLGADFKWWYLIHPLGISDDVAKQNAEEAERKKLDPGLDLGPKLNPDGSIVQAPAVHASPEKLARLAKARQKLALLASTRQQRAAYQDAPSYAPAPSASLADSLASTKSYLASQGVFSPTPQAAPEPAPGETVTGEEDIEMSMDDLADVVLDAWEQTDITDEPADPTRRTASLHHGAAYLEARSYPRYGASSGQEGGVIFPRETLHTNGASNMKNVHVFGKEEGGSAYDRGAEILGAGAPPKAPPKSRLAFRQVTTPAGNKALSMRPGLTKTAAGAKGGTRAAKHARSIANARDIAKRAISMGQKLAVAAKKTPAAAAKLATKAATARGTKLTGEELIGAVRAALKPTARFKATKGKAHRRLNPGQMKKLATIVTKAGKELKTHADKHAKLYDASTKREQSGAQAFSKKLTKIRGCDEVVFGDSDEAHSLLNAALEETLGAEIMADAVCDELFGETVTYTTTPGTGNVPVPGAADPNAIPMDTSTELPPDLLSEGDASTKPTLESVAAAHEAEVQDGPDASTDQMDYKILPDGAIVFDGAGAKMPKDIASWQYFYGSPKDGLIWEADHWNGGWDGWYGVLNDWGYDRGGRAGTAQSSQAAKYAQGAGLWSGGGPKNEISNKELQAISMAGGWGPLVGNPANPRLKNLRYCSGTDQWFWFWKQAPDEAKSPQLQIELARAFSDWKAEQAAAKADAAAAAIQDQLDADAAAAQAKQIAAEDAQMARQAEIDQKQLDRDAEVQARADEAAARQQQIADESAARMAESQNQGDIAMTQAAAEAERAQQQQEFEQGERAFQMQQEADVAAATAEAEAAEAAPSGRGNRATPSQDEEEQYEEAAPSGSARLRRAPQEPSLDEGEETPIQEQALPEGFIMDEGDLAAPSQDTGEFNLEEETSDLSE